MIATGERCLLGLFFLLVCTNPASAVSPTPVPTLQPSPLPTLVPTQNPTSQPSPVPTSQPSPLPTLVPTPIPTSQPSPVPTSQPSLVPTLVPTPVPTPQPSPPPTTLPTLIPTPQPSLVPTSQPSPLPTLVPTPNPTLLPTPLPTSLPTLIPTPQPSPVPTPQPTSLPTLPPSPQPSPVPTSQPTPLPTLTPSPLPTVTPTVGDTIKFDMDIRLSGPGACNIALNHTAEVRTIVAAAIKTKGNSTVKQRDIIYFKVEGCQGTVRRRKLLAPDHINILMTFTTSITEADYQTAAGFFDAAAESLVAGKHEITDAFVAACGCELNIDTIKVSLFSRWKPEDTVYKEPAPAKAVPYIAGSDCPNSCSGHGSCSTNGCVCHSGWGNGDERGGSCDQRQCSFEVAWVDTPTAENKGGHGLRECAGRGVCNRISGDCLCFAGFEGKGCRRTTCPSNEWAKKTHVGLSAHPDVAGAIHTVLATKEHFISLPSIAPSKNEVASTITPALEMITVKELDVFEAMRIKRERKAAQLDKKMHSLSVVDPIVKMMRSRVNELVDGTSNEQEETEIDSSSPEAESPSGNAESTVHSATTQKKRSFHEGPCSGHGTCEYIAEMRNDLGDSFKMTGNKVTRDQYDFESRLMWDAHKTRGCLCDPGYRGYDCSTRMCPRGDYKHFYELEKRPETQAVLFSNVFNPVTDIEGSDVDFKTSDLINNAGMGADRNGEFALTFRSTLNEEFTTKMLNVYNLTEGIVEVAINSLPNKVIQEASVVLYRNLSDANATAAKVEKKRNLGPPFDPTANYSWYDTDLVVLITFNGASTAGDQYALECKTAYCGAGCQPRLTDPLDFKKGSSCTVVNNFEEAVGVNWECSGRGECSADGVCQCYGGYADEFCSSKAALF